MKKKIVAVFLGLILVTGIIGSSVNKVSADQGTDAELGTDAEQAEESGESIEDTETEDSEVSEDMPVKDEEDMEETVITESEVTSESETEEEEAEITGMKVLLENTLEADVTSIEISTFSGEEYSENLLLNGAVLKVGESCTIGIPEAFQDQELGMYNVRITMADGQINKIPFVPFLENLTGTLYRQNDTILIRIRDSRLEAEEEVISEAEMIQGEAEASQVMAEALIDEIEEQ